MANDVIGGIRWVRSLSGGRMPVEEGVAITAVSGNIFTGDPVKPVSDGTFVVAAGGDTTISHICIGVKQYKAADGTIRSGNYLPTGTAYNGAPVLSNPEASILRLVPVRGQEFEIDCNTAAATLTAAQDTVFNNADISVGSGNTTSGRSACVLANSSPGTATANCRIRGIAQGPKNDVTAVNWKALIEFNELYAPGAVSTTGV